MYSWDGFVIVLKELLVFFLANGVYNDGCFFIVNPIQHTFCFGDYLIGLCTWIIYFFLLIWLCAWGFPDFEGRWYLTLKLKMVCCLR